MHFVFINPCWSTQHLERLTESEFFTCWRKAFAMVVSCMDYFIPLNNEVKNVFGKTNRSQPPKCPIISSTWRLKRALNSEKRYVRPAGLDAQNMTDCLRSIDYRYAGWQNFMKYETALERQIYKTMHELERLQRTSLGEKLPPPLAVEINVSHDMPDSQGG